MSYTEYKIGNAVVRMHGEAKREIIEPAAVRFLMKVEQKKRKAAKEKREVKHDAGDAVV